MALKKKYTVHWKDFNSPLMRNEIWVRFCQIWHTEFGLPFVPFGIISEKNAIRYFANMPAVQNLQKILVGRVTGNPAVLKEWIRQSDTWARALTAYTRSVQAADLSRLSTAQLRKMYERFADLQARQYAIGILLVSLDESFGPAGLDTLTRSLIEKSLPKNQRDEAYAILTQPFRDSFSREQEKELLETYRACVTPAMRSRLGSKKFFDIPKLEKALRAHAKKWAWVYYVYAGPAWTADNFFSVIKDWAVRRVDPARQLRMWERERVTLLAKRERLLKRMKLSAREKNLLSLGEIVWAKPRRKDFQSKAYWHMESWFREVARRLGISLREVRSMSQAMLWKSLEKGCADTRTISELDACHAVVPLTQGVRIFQGAKARAFIRANVYEKKVVITTAEFRGTSACAGKAKGVARVVNTRDDMDKMRKGDILVSVATTPSIVSAMRKAAAILTDEGGLTCHAALVSRELNIPCVIGLHVITSAVKDGDLVEVDATRGVVQIIKQ